MALAPALGDHVDHRSAAALFPVVVAAAPAVDAARAALHDAGVQAGRRGQHHGRADASGARLAHQAAEGDRGGRRAAGTGQGIAPEQQVAFAAAEARTRAWTRARTVPGPGARRRVAAGIPAEPACGGLHVPGPAAGREAGVEAEHAVEKTRRVGPHELATQAVARRGRAGLLQHRSAFGGEPARPGLRVGQEGRGHHRLDGRRRHRIVEDRRVEQRIRAVLHRVRQAPVAIGGAARPVDLLARARRERAGQRLDAAAGDIDHRHRGHPHHRAFEQRRAELARPARHSRLAFGRRALRRLVFVASHAQATADVVPAGVAGGGLLGQRLQRGGYGEGDRIADVDRRAVQRDAVAGGRARRCAGRCAGQPGLGNLPIQRLRRLAQRVERLEQGRQGRRHAPARVVGSVARARLAGQRHRHSPRHGAGEALRAAAAGEKVGRRRAVRRATEEDAAGHPAPGVAAHHGALADRHLLARRPAREHGLAGRAAPRQRVEQAGIGTQQRSERAGQVRAAQCEGATGGVRRLQRRRQGHPRGLEPARRVQPEGPLDAGIRAAAEAQQRGVECAQSGGDLRGHADVRPRRVEAAVQPAPDVRVLAPLGAACGHAGQHVGRRRRCRNRGASALDDRRLEGLECRDVAHAGVAVGAAEPAHRLGIGRPRHRDQPHHAQHHRQYRQAGGDREIEQAVRTGAWLVRFRG